MRKTFVLDFEATGIDPNVAYPLEVCVYSYNVDNKQGSVALNEVIWESSYPLIEQKIFDLTGLSNDELVVKGLPPKEVFNRLVSLFEPQDGKDTVVVAHNATGYDKVLFLATCKRLEIPPPNIIWIDTLRDLPYSSRCMVLSHMALDMGFTVDPSTLHRAEADVELLCKILSKFEFRELFRRATGKKVFVRANVSYDERDLAKAQSFRWQQTHDGAPIFKKQWVKQILESELTVVRAACSFQIEIVQE